MPIHLTLDSPAPGRNPYQADITMRNEKMRIPCLLLIDAPNPSEKNARSRNQKILQMFQEMLAQDSHFRNALDVCVMSIGITPQLEQDFVSGRDFQVPTLSADTRCSLNSALNMALTKLEQKCGEYDLNFIQYTPPVLFLISGGNTSDTAFEKDIRNRLHDKISQNRLVFVPMVLDDANTDYLRAYYPTDFPGKILEEPSPSNFRDAMPSLWDMPKLQCIRLIGDCQKKRRINTCI